MVVLLLVSPLALSGYCSEEVLVELRQQYGSEVEESELEEEEGSVSGEARGATEEAVGVSPPGRAPAAGGSRIPNPLLFTQGLGLAS
jgi:hypothetical protein